MHTRGHTHILTYSHTHTLTYSHTLIDMDTLRMLKHGPSTSAHFVVSPPSSLKAIAAIHAAAKVDVPRQSPATKMEEDPQENDNENVFLQVKLSTPFVTQ